MNLFLNDLQNDFELPTRKVKRRAKSLSVRLEAESERKEYVIDYIIWPIFHILYGPYQMVRMILFENESNFMT